jgi:hypothetical protein
MSPWARVELQIAREIVEILRRWLEALESHVEQAGDALGPSWAEGDLVRLYEAWVEAGQALRDVARTVPTESQNEVREELRTLEQRLGRIAEILERQVRADEG